jgi:hypothetical protein
MLIRGSPQHGCCGLAPMDGCTAAPAKHTRWLARTRGTKANLNCEKVPPKTTTSRVSYWKHNAIVALCGSFYFLEWAFGLLKRQQVIYD